MAFATANANLAPIRIPTRSLNEQKTAGRVASGRKRSTVGSSFPRSFREESSIRQGRRRDEHSVARTARLNLGSEIDYPEPRSIGADRLANAAAVAQLYGYPAIVVDFGTAVTFDIVSADGAYIGGVIAPGLEAMTNFLYQRTALLPKLTLREPSARSEKRRGTR